MVPKVKESSRFDNAGADCDGRSNESDITQELAKKDKQLTENRVEVT